MVRQKRESDAATFSTLHRKLQGKVSYLFCYYFDAIPFTGQYKIYVMYLFYDPVVVWGCWLILGALFSDP